MATGIAVCGAGVGCFMFAPIGRWLLETYDWKNALLITAGVVLNSCVCGAVSSRHTSILVHHLASSGLKQDRQEQSM